MKEKFGKVIIL